MPLNLSVIAAGGAILCHDKQIPAGNRQAIQRLIETLPKHDSKVSYQIANETFHCLIENGIMYFVVADPEVATRTAYGMLIDTKEAFKEAFGGGAGRYPPPSDLTPARCGRFGSTLAAKVRYFNENPDGDKIGRVRQQIEDVKMEMLQNLDSLIARGNQIDTLTDKSATLAEEAEHFEDNSRTLHRTMLMRHCKIIVTCVLVVCVLGWIISMFICKPNYSKCKSAPAPVAPPGPTSATAASSTTAAPVTTATTTAAPTPTLGLAAEVMNVVQKLW